MLLGRQAKLLARRMILDAPRAKRRTTRRLLIPVALSAAAILALVVAAAGSDTRAELAYLDSLHDQVAEIAVGAESLSDVAGRLASANRVEFVTVTDSIRSDVAAGLTLTEAGAPSDSLVAVNSLYRQALLAWNRGITGFASGVLVAADDPFDTVVAENLADALAELRAGDELYRQLVLLLGEDDVPSPMAPMPDVILTTSDGGLISVSRTYVEAARSPLNTLALRPGLGISQLLADPEWVVNPDEQAVLPATGEAVFSVVVINSGNVISAPETLTLTLTGGAEVVEMSTQLEPLEAGRLRTVTFDPITVESGLVYEVVTMLMVSGVDTNLADNEISVVFIVNEGDGGG